MKRHQVMIAGTALALLMGAPQLGAAPLGSIVADRGAGAIGPTLRNATKEAFPLILVQAEDEELEEEGEADPEPEPEAESQPEPEPEPEEELEPEAEDEPAPDPPEPADDVDGTEEPAEQADEPADEAEQPADESDESVEETDTLSEEPVENGEPPVEELEEPIEEPAEEPVDDVESPAEDADEPAEEPVDDEMSEEPAEEPADEAEQPIEAMEEAAEEPAEEPADEADEPLEDADESADEPVDDDVSEDEPVDESEEPVEGTEESPDELLEEAEPADEGEAIDEDAEAAPLLDSEKEEELAVEPETEELDEPGEPETVFEPLEDETPPASDAESQRFEEPVEVESLRAIEGQRIDRQAFEPRRQRREGANILDQIQDRFLIQFGNQTIVESDDRQRLGYGATEVYYDELRRGHTRETIVRPNGVQVITIRDAYGDIVRRSRIMPDGQEYVLIYADERGRDRPGRRGWRDPARELPPLRLNIPREEYILEAGQVRDYDRYYDFLDLPPVEPVRRLYSVDEVKYSARVRDIARRVDIDTVTFDFGSASISESQIAMLEGIASAMDRMLDEDPAETFLIEGHTDAVGSEQANLVLSDRRAESVAMALTNVFGIPPENLVTQGYGKRYLKIDTQEAERRNRRVAVRRITPLVAPMAQLQ